MKNGQEVRFYLDLFFFLLTRTRESRPANACQKSVRVEYFDLNRSRLEFSPAGKGHQGLGDSEDETDAKIFSVPASETGQQSAPHIQLEMMPRKPQQSNADRVLVKLTN